MGEEAMNRRSFIKSTTLASTLGYSALGAGVVNSIAQTKVERVGGSKLKISCNLFSFNSPLQSGALTLDSVLEFCAQLGFDAVDPTAYYFPGYPKTPPDDYLYHIKRKAFVLGLDISGTGVRNDFTVPDAALRQADVDMVKSWIECAARLGAPVLRVFAGSGIPEGRTEDEVNGWIVDGIRKCVGYAAKSGVLISIQNHNDFIKTSAQVRRILQMVDSEWFGVNLDIGSFRTGDPYEEIARVLPYAITCQIKENLYYKDKEVKTDLARLFRLFKEAGYRGYIPIETLGEGDPKVKVPRFLDEVRKALA